MKRYLTGVLLLLTACAGTGMSATSSAPGLAASPWPPIGALLGNRDALELSSPQVMALDTLAAGLRARNEPLVRHLRLALEEPASEGLRPPRRGVERQRVAATLLQLSANNEAAMAAVADIVDEIQRWRACEILNRQLVSRWTDEKQERRRYPRGRGGVTWLERDAWDAALGYRAAPWSWCHSPAEAGGS
jgi:hypothetical protein